MRLGMSDTFAKTFQLSTLSNSLNSCINRLHPSNSWFKGNLSFLVPTCFTLQRGEVFRIPSMWRELHVLSGIAWITVAGKDIVLTSGEKASLTANEGSAILSTLGKEPLILEVL
jgi:hypothetical protein